MSARISDEDLRVLAELSKENEHARELLEKITKNATVIKKRDKLRRTVGLNSLVLLWHSFLRKVVRIRIVHPKNSDLSRRNISVLSPISLALFGRRENESVRVNIGGISKELKIIKVTNPSRLTQ